MYYKKRVSTSESFLLNIQLSHSLLITYLFRFQPANKIAISIIDKGVGITRENVLLSTYIGLDLFSSRNIIKIYGGSISVLSERIVKGWKQMEITKTRIIRKEQSLLFSLINLKSFMLTTLEPTLFFTFNLSHNTPNY